MEDYIIIHKRIDNDKYMITKPNINGDINIYSNSVKIHKKHKAILDAYLLDNSVEIEQCSNGDWYEININPYYDAFIRFYDENNQYRLKHSFEEQLINGVIGNGVETIQAPNSDIDYKKVKWVELKMPNYMGDKYSEHDFIFKYKGIEYDITPNFKDKVICGQEWLDGLFNLKKFGFIVRYELKKQWYEDESNFPCVIVDKMNHNDIRIVKENMGINWEVYRPATNEEIDSLKIKDANF